MLQSPTVDENSSKSPQTVISQRILIVDDDAVIRYDIRQQLLALGHMVVGEACCSLVFGAVSGRQWRLCSGGRLTITYASIMNRASRGDQSGEAASTVKRQTMKALRRVAIGLV